MVFSRPPSPPVAELDDVETREERLMKAVLNGGMPPVDECEQGLLGALKKSVEKVLRELDIAAQMLDDSGLEMLAECVKSAELLLSVEAHIDFTKSASRAYIQLQNAAYIQVRGCGKLDPIAVEVILAQVVNQTCDVLVLSICRDIGFPWRRAAFDKAAPLAFDGTLRPDHLLELQQAFDFNMGLPGSDQAFCRNFWAELELS